VIVELRERIPHLDNARSSRENYFRFSGEATQMADSSRMSVVRAGDSGDASDGSQWFRTIEGIDPGDAILVPLEAERMRPPAPWQSGTQILDNNAISVAAVHAL